MKYFRLSFLLLFLISAFSCAGDSDVEVDGTIISSKDRIKDYMKRYVVETAPGIVYISINEKGLYHANSAGFEQIGGAVPMTLKSLINTNTAAQVYTTVAILQLAERGLVDINAPLSNYFSDHPYGTDIKIIHLLAHSSGISNPSPISWVHMPEEHASFDAGASLKEAMDEHDKLKFTPGTQVSYSALGYWILGRVVEKVTKRPFENYVETKIFAPLGLKNSEIFYRLNEKEPPETAQGYLEQSSFFNFLKGFWSEDKLWGGVERGWVKTNAHYFNHPAFGGLWGTPGALMKVMQDFLQKRPRLFKAKTRDMMFVPWRDESGDALPIALGWRAGSLSNGDRFYFIEGGGAGFRSEFRVYPSLKISTAVVVNKTVFNSRLVLSTLDTELFKGFALKEKGSKEKSSPEEKQ